MKEKNRNLSVSITNEPRAHEFRRRWTYKLRNEREKSKLTKSWDTILESFVKRVVRDHCAV